jgi:hypothetical protein
MYSGGGGNLKALPVVLYGMAIVIISFTLLLNSALCPKHLILAPISILSYCWKR